MLNIFSLKTRKNQTSLLLDKAAKRQQIIKTLLEWGSSSGSKKMEDEVGKQ